MTSGIPQGSVLAPIMFLIYMNDMPEGVNSYISILADDANLMKKVKSQRDCEKPQKDINKIYRWEMEFNVKKCHVLEMEKVK